MEEINMADLKSIGKAIGRVATNYLEAQQKRCQIMSRRKKKQNMTR